MHRDKAVGSPPVETEAASAKTEYSTTPWHDPFAKAKISHYYRRYMTIPTARAGHNPVSLFGNGSRHKGWVVLVDLTIANPYASTTLDNAARQA